MGKRELLLAVAFVVVGVVVYQFTAPPADPSRPGFSLSRLVDQVRREVRGQRESAEGRKTTTIEVPATVKEIRLAIPGATTLTIVGESRDDIETDFEVRSTGYDTEEANRLVQESLNRFKVDEAGALLILNYSFPQAGRQTAKLTIKLPSRLGLRMDAKSGTMQVSNLASVSIGPARGETTIKGIAGAVSINQRGSVITISDVGSLKLQTVAGAEARVSNVRGEAAFNLQGGELRAEHLAGPLEVESRNAEMRFEHLDKLQVPVRVNATGGEIEFLGLRTEARIDGRNSDVRIVQAAAALLSVYNDNDGADAIELTLAGDGQKIDAVASRGDIRLDETLVSAGLTVSGPPEGDGEEKRLTGALRGGGPTVTLRATRGDIVLKSR